MSYWQLSVFSASHKYALDPQQLTVTGPAPSISDAGKACGWHLQPVLDVAIGREWQCQPSCIRAASKGSVRRVTDRKGGVTNEGNQLCAHHSSRVLWAEHWGLSHFLKQGSEDSWVSQFTRLILKMVKYHFESKKEIKERVQATISAEVLASSQQF